MILAPGPRNEIPHVHGLFSKDLSGRTGRETLLQSAFPAKIAAGSGPYDMGRLMTWAGWKRGVAALTRRDLRTPPDHGAPVFAVAIMVASAGLSWVFSGVHDMWSAPDKPAIKIWCAACVSQGASHSAQGTFLLAAHGGSSSTDARSSPRLMTLDPKKQRLIDLSGRHQRLRVARVLLMTASIFWKDARICCASSVDASNAALTYSSISS